MAHRRDSAIITEQQGVVVDRQRAKAAYTQLQTIVDGIDGATLAQAKTAIKQIAQISQDLIRATVGR